MVTFNELRVSPNGDRLIIDVEITQEDYFNNAYIDGIIIDTQYTYISNGPSDKFIYKLEGNTTRRLNIELTSKDLGNTNISKSLFFVYVIPQGLTEEELISIPCEYNTGTTLGVTCDLYPIYRKILSGLKEVENTCETPSNLMNTLLQFKALEIWLKTGQYEEAIKYWNKFFIQSNISRTTNTCNCHG